MTNNSSPTDLIEFFKANHLMMLIIEAATNKIVDANPAACAFYGYSQEEITKLSMSDINVTPPDELTKEIKHAVQEARNYLLLKHSLADGIVRDVSVYSASVNPNAHGLMYLIIDDVTIQKQKNLAFKKNEERLAFALENSGDGVWDFDIKSENIFYSKVWKEILGYVSSGENVELFSVWESRLHPDDRAKALKAWDDHFSGKAPLYDCEYRLQMAPDTYMWIHDRGKVVEWDENGNPTRAVGTDSDITKRKEMEIELSEAVQDLKRREKEIRHLSLHDDLTGLPNRRYLGAKLEALNTEENMPLTILIGDVNGLKLTNDIFGHSEGDKILVQAADIMKRACRADDFIARWGGDEFILILPNTNPEEAELILQRIKAECEKASESSSVAPSISLGFSTKDSVSTDNSITLKMAEDMMYTSKLLENRSFRSSLISSMKNTLHEKSHETEAHANRLSLYCLKIAAEMNIPESQLDELELLSVLHDIGKIAIRDTILNKPGPLDEHEWIEMRRHSEIGYHIAKSAPELTQIAEYILCHHERWDGKGYPRGIKGTDIPLFSRILAAVDAFDVMTSARAYKTAISPAEAIEELKRNSGTQFDPAVIECFLKLIPTTES